MGSVALDCGADPAEVGDGEHASHAGAPLSSAGSPTPDIHALLTSIESVRACDVVDLGPVALGSRVCHLRRAIAMLDAHQVACVGTMDARGDANMLGFRSIHGWLRSVARVAPGAAKGLTALARRLRHPVVAEGSSDPVIDVTSGDAGESMSTATESRLAGSFANGRISLAHVQVVARTIEDLAPLFDDKGDTAKVEAGLVEVAERTDPLTLADACRRLRIKAAPEQAAADEWSAFEQRDLSISKTFEGLVAINGVLDPLGGETVMAALHALSGPSGTDDLRTAGQRRADALVELSRRSLAFGDLPLVGGERPHVSAIVPLAEVEERSGAEPGELGWTGPVSGALIRRILCDAAVTRVVVDGASQPLDVGRATRVVPAGLRKAVAIRDRHCQWPGCDVPAVWCDCHHIVFWSRGGRTCVSNLIMLCGYHHTRLHLSGQTIRRHPDGRTALVPYPQAEPGSHHGRDP